MQFDSFHDFLAMNGHGLYVWAAYAVWLIIVVYNIVSPLLAKGKIRQQVLRQIRRDEQTSSSIETSKGVTE